MKSLYFNVLFLSALVFSCFTQAIEVPSTTLINGCKPLINKNYKPKSKSISASSAKVYRGLVSSAEKVEEKKYNEAINILKGLLASAESDFDKATLNYNLGGIVYQKTTETDKNANVIAKVLPYFEKALKFGRDHFPYERAQALKVTVAQLLYFSDRKKEALVILKDWTTTANKDNELAYLMLSIIYLDEERHKESLCAAYYAAKTSTRPNKSHLEILAINHNRLKSLSGTATILKKAIEYFPKEKRFWLNLANIYFQREKTSDALAVMETIYLQNKLKDSGEYSLLSSLYYGNDIPFRSAEVIEEGLNKKRIKETPEQWRRAAQMYHYSNELDKAIKAYIRTAELSSKADDYLKVAELYTDDRKWGNALKFFNKVIGLGGLDNKDIASAYFRKGYVLFNMGSCSSAQKALSQSAKYKAYRVESVQLSDYIQYKIDNDKC